MTPKRKKILFGVLTFFILLLIALLIAGPFIWSQEGLYKKVRQVHCLNNLKQLGLAMSLYEADHPGKRPRTLSDFIPYIGGDNMAPMFMCPSVRCKLTTSPPKLVSQFKDHLDYLGYDLLSATGLVEGPVSATIEPVMCDRPGNHGDAGILILFADGHVSKWSGTLSDYARSNSLAITLYPIGLN
jgi:prepilin-type processing-associated H-X9-DG protein